MNFPSMLEKQGKPPLVLAAGFALIGFIGVVDFMTGYEIGFSLFYLFPVSLVTWLTRRRFGLLTSFAAASAWYWADVATGHLYSHTLIPLWNTLIRLGFFVIITLLLSALRRAMEREKELARTDNLTGAVNSRFFLCFGTNGDRPFPKICPPVYRGLHRPRRLQGCE